MRFRRMREAFDADVALARGKRCSGSKHSPESSTDLFDLALSFMEDNGRLDEKEDIVRRRDCDEKSDGEEVEKISEWCDNEKSEMLKELFDGNDDADEDERDAKEMIRKNVEVAIGELGGSDSIANGFKERLMSQLREKGFDVGLCKIKWEKNGKLTAGDYEYIDVNLSEKRYIVEVSLATKFEIARPTNQYSSLLNIFPRIFVGKMEELKRIVRLMCYAIKDSMKKMNLHIPPWRRNMYMQTKWFSSYKRTINAIEPKKASSHFSAGSFLPKKFMGFEARHVKAYNCRDDYLRINNGFRIGYLTSALNSDNFRL